MGMKLLSWLFWWVELSLEEVTAENEQVFKVPTWSLYDLGNKYTIVNSKEAQRPNAGFLCVRLELQNLGFK